MSFLVASFSSQMFVELLCSSLKLYDKHRWLLKHSKEQDIASVTVMLEITWPNRL